MATEGNDRFDVVHYAVVCTERRGPLLVRLPPELQEKDIIRVTVGGFPNGMTVVNLYTEADFGYAYNVDCPEFSEWGDLPPEEETQ